MILDCELRPDEELSGLGGNLCFNHDLVESHRRSQSSSRTLQLRLRVAARQSVRPPHSLVLCGQPKIASRVFFTSREMSFPRLGQMVVDYDPPMKRIAEEFIPHSKV